MTLDEAIRICQNNYVDMENSLEIQNLAFQLGVWLTELREYKRRFPNFQIDLTEFKQLKSNENTTNTNENNNDSSV